MKKYILIIISILLTVLFACNIALSFNFKSVSTISKLNEIRKSKIIENILGIIDDLKSLPNGSVSKVQKETQNINSYMNDVGKEIIRCIKERDKKGISNIFCDKIKDTEYLNNEINIIFDYIDNNGGISIEDGEWTSPVGHGSNDYDGKTVEYLSCKYMGDVRIGDKKYELRFTAYKILKKHLEYQGLLTVTINEYISDEDLDKIDVSNNSNNNKQKKVFLGFQSYILNKKTFMYESILPNDFYKNDLYLIPDNLEDDR